MAEAFPYSRTRDPARKERILAAAADLVARKGFHAVAIDDIGAAAGISGSGVYRHFESKSAVLVALFDRVIDGLRRDEQDIMAHAADPHEALRRLVAGQVEYVVADRELAIVYRIEVHNLPEEDRRRLRRKQRMYIEDWVHLLVELRSDLDDAEARTLVHSAIGVIQSALTHNCGLAEDVLRDLLSNGARSVLGCD